MPPVPCTLLSYLLLWQVGQSLIEGENHLESSNNSGGEREAKFLNYWLTRTVTETNYSYTVTTSTVTQQ